MKPVTLTAIFDGRHIRLEQDYPLSQNARLLVTLLPEGGAREDWRGLASPALTRAYGEDEPDYTLDMLQEPNAAYGGR